MYLKSLVLKGFKSFADRSVLTLEPGITAIVGPNGSGKSNISDAVLWVLGERSARNLRGQAMEDIIFSGSAARRAVSVAEVDLVLDNSDHVLPVDFDEVVITRRMYRSGESEYLVNGVVARRLDVLDILHDTGLGTGTHSIISQGSLDSILQSKPEDRRALIEEAAGVLKHKRRKEKSARKLEQMENHLDRVRDVTAEVARQLGPLERKAKRAQAYAKASGQLAEVKLALAVDDLRKLQVEWGEVCAAEKAASDEVATRRSAVEAAERRVNDCQELLRRESEDANVVARRQRRASSLSERLDGADLLLRERRRAAEESLASMAASLEGSSLRRAEVVADLAEVERQLSEVRQLCEQADSKVDELAKSRADVDDRRRSIESSIGELADKVGVHDRQLEAAKRTQAQLQETLADGMAQAKLAQARIRELDSELVRAQEEYDATAEAQSRAEAELEDITKREAQAQQDLIARFEDRDAAHGVRDRVHREVSLAESEQQAIEQALAAMRDDDPALSWVLRNASSFSGGVVSVSKAFKVTRGLESLVEQLLGHDLAALAVQDANSALQIAKALADGKVPGDMAMVIRQDASAATRTPAAVTARGRALLEDIEYPDDMKPVVEALLGDVVLCDDREAAFAAHASHAEGVRYVSLDGCVVWPSGKVQVLGPADEDAVGVIARERRLSELHERLASLLEERAAADSAADAADEAYREVQVEALKLSQQLANQKGACESARAEEERARKRIQALEADRERATQQVQTAEKAVGELQASADAAATEVEELSAKRQALVVERESLLAAVAPLRNESTQIGEQFTEARLQAAKLSERRTYVQRLVIARQRDIESIDSTAQAARSDIAVKRAAVARAEAMLVVFEELATALSRRVRLLDEALAASESSSSGVHADAANARDEARKAHDEYDTASSNMAQVRIDKSRLEMRVEAAVNAVVHDLGTPIDKAQELPELQDRKAAEDEAFKLERKIKGMGTINPDAAQEYAQLKERYDYLAGQLSDMESARRSLNRIVKVIDERMRDDFVRTYEEVNRNFNEVFSELFPGGSAHLSFDDPDDIENTGVEVTAQPQGKRLTKMMLMSGGEKSLTALALLFAVYKTRATPFYILDEVEAALDDTNLRRLASYIDKLRDSTQLIMITHQRRTMEMADVLFGVSMHADGVTKVVSQKLERALEHAE